MTHYRVTVFAESIKQAEEMLAPYDENLTNCLHVFCTDQVKYDYYSLEDPDTWGKYVTAAILDPKGWHEHGAVGWFGASQDNMPWWVWTIVFRIIQWYWKTKGMDAFTYDLHI